MDQRKTELKHLRREYRRARRRMVAPWKFLCIVSALCAVLLTLAGAYPLYAGYLVRLHPIFGSVSIEPHMLLAVRLGAAVVAVIALSAVFMWAAGRRKLKKSDAYLSWRTMREALRAEQKLR